jgi:hypothetical protein
MPKIFKPKGSDKYVLFYTDHTGQRRRKKTLTGDKETSERIARDTLNKNALREEGLIDEQDERFAEHAGRSTKLHLDDYLLSIASEGVSEKHISHVRKVVSRILDLAKIKRIPDLTLSRVQDAIAVLRKTHSTGTINSNIQRVKSFSRWLWRDKRAREYTLVDLHRKDAKHDRRHVRRRVTEAEIMAVIAAAEVGPMVKGMTGPYRAMLYRIAYGMGFRANESRNLAAEEIRLDGDPPTITVLGAYTKNSDKAVQPIKASLADKIRP